MPRIDPILYIFRGSFNTASIGWALQQANITFRHNFITMASALHPDDIHIRTTLQPGDVGYVTYLHGSLYSLEYNYGVTFEAYVAEGLAEFCKQYDTAKDRVWISNQYKVNLYPKLKSKSFSNPFIVYQI